MPSETRRLKALLLEAAETEGGACERPEYISALRQALREALRLLNVPEEYLDPLFCAICDHAMGPEERVDVLTGNEAVPVHAYHLD